MAQATMIPIIRTGQVTGKSLKGKSKQPTLNIVSQNGEKFSFNLNTKDDLEAIPIGKELRIRLEEVPHRAFEEVTQSESQIPQVPAAPSVTCPKGVLADEYGHSEVCPGCEHNKAKDASGLETYCDLTTSKDPDQPSGNTL